MSARAIALVALFSVPSAADAPLGAPGADERRAPGELLVDDGGRAGPITLAVQRACGEVVSTLGPPRRRKKVRVRVASDAQHFTDVTGRPAFEAAAFVDDTIWLASTTTRDRLFHLDLVYRHECVHAWLAADGSSPSFRVVEEAFAMRVAGQSARLPPARPYTTADIEAAESLLGAPRDRLSYEATLARVAATFAPCLRGDRASLTDLARHTQSSMRPLATLVGEGGPCGPAKAPIVPLPNDGPSDGGAP